MNKPLPKATEPDAKLTPPEKVWVRTVQGELLHLYTNVWFTTDPKKVVLDQFLQAQLDAGKLVISDE